MEKVFIQQPGPYCDVTVDGTVIALSAKDVTPVSIDCEARATDSQVIIDVTSAGNGTLHDGMAGEAYVASVVIPPRDYVATVDKKKKDGNGNPIITTKPAPVDMNKVTLKLWRYELPVSQAAITEI